MRSQWLGLILTSIVFACTDNTGEDPSKATSATHDSIESAVRVRVAPAERARLQSEDTLSVVVSADQRALLRAEVPGRVVERIALRGARVEKDAPLLRLDASRLQLAHRRAEAQLASARAELRQASRALERGRKLRARDTISEAREDDLQTNVERARAQVDLAQATRDQAARDLADAAVRAPFEGIVEDWQVDVGDFVQPATPLVTLVDLDRVRLRGGVTAAQANALKKGESATVLFSRQGSGAQIAVLESIGVVADPATGTYELEFVLENPEGQLREGMVATVLLPQEATKLDMAIPREALFQTPLGMGIFVVDGSEPPRARLQIVTVGRTTGDRVAVLDGVNEGERIVVEGQFALSDGDPITLDMNPGS